IYKTDDGFKTRPLTEDFYRTGLTEEERQGLRHLMPKDNAERNPVARPRPPLLKRTHEVADSLARLKHLCRLIARDRYPSCPVNGLLVLIPFAATESRDAADQTGEVCRQELTVARQALQVHCPLFALVCDLERIEGFREFEERFPPADRQRRMGRSFPLRPDL